jgi:hypothetical protein
MSLRTRLAKGARAACRRSVAAKSAFCAEVELVILTGGSYIRRMKALVGVQKMQNSIIEGALVASSQ